MTSPIEYSLESGVPLFRITVPDTTSPFLPCLDEVVIFQQIERVSGGVVNQRSLLRCTFRGTSIERLPAVLDTGIDVAPTDAAIYADYFSKAVEYGGWPKVVLALRPECMKRTFVDISAETPAEEFTALRATYPTAIKSVDGSRWWLSRLGENDSALATDYETHYAYWIPGNAKEAIVAVLILVHPVANVDSFGQPRTQK